MGAEEITRWPLGEAAPGPREPHPTRAGRYCGARVALYADWHDAERGASVHEAQDIFAPRGTPVLAPASGRVLRSAASTGPAPSGGGDVRLVTPARSQIQLSHLDAPPLVRAGDTVVAGQLLGAVGSSGSAARTCPHLHIGMRDRDRVAVRLYDRLRALAAERNPMATVPPPPRPPGLVQAGIGARIALVRAIEADVYRARIQPIGDAELEARYRSAVTEPLARLDPDDPSAPAELAQILERANDITGALDRAQREVAEARARGEQLATIVLLGPILGGVVLSGQQIGRRVSSLGTESSAALREVGRQVGESAIGGLTLGAVALGGLALGALALGALALSKGRKK